MVQAGATRQPPRTPSAVLAPSLIYALTMSSDASRGVGKYAVSKGCSYVIENPMSTLMWGYAPMEAELETFNVDRHEKLKACDHLSRGIISGPRAAPDSQQQPQGQGSAGENTTAEAGKTVGAQSTRALPNAPPCWRRRSGASRRPGPRSATAVSTSAPTARTVLKSLALACRKRPLYLPQCTYGRKPRMRGGTQPSHRTPNPARGNLLAETVWRGRR